MNEMSETVSERSSPQKCLKLAAVTTRPVAAAACAHGNWVVGFLATTHWSLGGTVPSGLRCGVGGGSEKGGGGKQLPTAPGAAPASGLPGGVCPERGSPGADR